MIIIIKTLHIFLLDKYNNIYKFCMFNKEKVKKNNIIKLISILSYSYFKNYQITSLLDESTFL